MPTIALACLLAVCSSSTDLTRLYKPDSRFEYDFSLKARHDSGPQVGATAHLEFAVKSLEKDGRARTTVSAKTFNLKMDDAEMGGGETPPSSTELLDSAGMPETLSVEENAWVFMLFECGGMVPGRPLEEGETFKVARTKGGEVTGTIRFAGTVEVEGKTYLKLETKLEVKPHSDPNPGRLDVVTLLDPADRWPISIKGKLEIENQATGEIEFKRRAAG